MGRITTYIALLRGINVGGHHVVKMQELRNLLTTMGLAQVKTYIQSGNIVFKSEEEAALLQTRLESVIKENFGFSVPVIIRTASKWKQIISNCPYSVDSLEEGESVHLALSMEEASKEGVDRLLEYKSDLEECSIRDRETYLFLRQSFRQSKLAANFSKLGIPVTVRNWKTVKKLEAMVDEMDD